MRIECCPQQQIGAEICDALRHVKYADKGFLPMPGGTLDQTHWFMEACEFVWAEQSIAERNQLEQLKKS